jgi:hypothetical protein
MLCAIIMAGCGLMGSSSAMAHNGWHGLKIKVRPNARSIFVVNTDFWGVGQTWCFQRQRGNTWWGPGAGSKNGTRVTVLQFTSDNCTAGSLGKKMYTVPGKDGLDNFWIHY